MKAAEIFLKMKASRTLIAKACTMLAEIVLLETVLTATGRAAEIAADVVDVRVDEDGVAVDVTDVAGPAAMAVVMAATEADGTRNLVIVCNAGP